MSLSILDTLKTRRTIRRFTTQPVEEEKIKQLLEAATWAPNDRMRQPWHFYILGEQGKQDYEKIARQFLEEEFPDNPDKVKSSLERIRNTPLIMIVTADLVPDDPGASTDNEYAVCCAIHSMWLAAHALGLGLVWRTRGIGLVRDPRLYQLIGSPINKKIIGTLHIGYPEGELPPEKKRIPYSEKTTWL